MVLKICIFIALFVDSVSSCYFISRLNYLCIKIQLNIHHLNSDKIATSGICKDHLNGAFIHLLTKEQINFM